MKTDLEGPSAKSPLTTHKWASSDDFLEKTSHEETLSQDQSYKPLVYNDKPANNLQSNPSQLNQLQQYESQPTDQQYKNRIANSETVQQNFTAKPLSPIQRNPQSFHIRPKTQFPIKCNHVDTGIVSKDDTWKSSFGVQDEMRYQQMVQQEYPLDSIMYHNRGKPRALHLQVKSYIIKYLIFEKFKLNIVRNAYY